MGHRTEENTYLTKNFYSKYIKNSKNSRMRKATQEENVQKI